jgi:hypothetical protein
MFLLLLDGGSDTGLAFKFHALADQDSRYGIRREVCG